MSLRINGDKYTATIGLTGDVVIERYGEDWVTIDSGCNAVASMVRELVDARALILAIEHDEHDRAEELIAEYREMGWTE